MQVNKRFWPAFCIFTLGAITALNGDSPSQFLCPASWQWQEKSCWKALNDTDYCDAMETCHFHVSSLSNKTSTFTVMSTNDLWIHDDTILGHDKRNLSCFATQNNNLDSDSCPIRLAGGTTNAVNCSRSQKFVCESRLSIGDLGLQNGEIKSRQLSSSSFYSSENEPIAFEPRFARLGQDYTTGAATQGGWCSINATVEEYFQLDFGKATLVTEIKTQGVKGRICDFWVTMFNISFITASEEWLTYDNNGTNESLIGNNDASSIVALKLAMPFITSKLRIHPTGFGNNCQTPEKRFCLRLEVYGIHFVSLWQKEIDVKEEYRIDASPTKNISSVYSRFQQVWPSGAYAIPKPISGCPDSKKTRWDYGYILHDVSLISNLNESTHNLANSISSLYFVEEFCNRISGLERIKTMFPPGQYCVFMIGDECPVGFASGSLKFYEKSANWNKTWTHIKGISLKSSSNFDINDINCCFAEVFYCCRDNGLVENLELPSSVPFYLLPKTSSCPKVINTHQTMEYIDLEIEDKHYDISKIGFGSHPYVLLYSTSVPPLSRKVMRYFICHYKPAVKNSTRMELKIENEVDTINSNYALDLKLSMLFNGSLIKHGDYSELNFSIAVVTNCTASIANSTFASTEDIGIYNAGVSLSHQCGLPVNVTMEIIGLTHDMKAANFSLNATIVSKTNILIFVRNESVDQSSAIIGDLDQLETQLNSKSSGPKRKFKLSTFIYDDAHDVINKLRDLKDKRKCDPDRIHGIAAFNSERIQDILNSFASIENIAFLTGQTNANHENSLTTNTLQISTAIEDELHRTFNKLKRMNVTKLVVIRALGLRVPISFAYYLLEFNFLVVKEIVIQDQASISSIKSSLGILQNFKETIYFMTNKNTASRIFIAAVQLGISPKDGYRWISGSPSGIYEHGVGSKACYKLKPVSCSVAFSKTMMFGGLHPAISSAFTLNGASTRIESGFLNNKSSTVHNELQRAMILDSAEIIASTIQTLTNRNETIETFDLLSMIQERKLSRLKGLRFLFLHHVIVNTNISSVCMQGWSGKNCTSPTCEAHHCFEGKGSCVAYETCECHPGFYGKDCSGLCQNRCKHGVCNEGALGDGTCTECDWLYEGIYCDKATVLQAMIASCLGSLMVVIILTCYLLKVCRPRQSGLNIGDTDESHWIIDWNEFSEMEQMNISKGISAAHLTEKLRHREYFRAQLRGECVFVTCLKKKPIKLSLDVRVEIRKVKKLDHINVEKVKAVCLGPPFVAIVTTLANMGSLYDTLHTESVDVPIEIKYAFMEDICRGMIFLHEKCGMPHGRLKSTNCLLHKGWRVKITDIGLASLRKNIVSDVNGETARKYGYYNQDLDQQKQNTAVVDFNSLLWTAPEYLGPSIVNIDQIGHVRFEGDVYSFGILMAEILTRRPPYGEIKVMSIQHIVEAIAHLREPMVDLEVIRPGSPKTRQDVLSKQAKILRPSVGMDDLPKEEPGKSILKVLIESAWSDDPEIRPPFSHIKTVLRIIAPLKGDQLEKRAFLLEKETETLEKYIAYDTKMINKEREKADDWLGRSMPSEVYTKLKNGERIEAWSMGKVSIASFQIDNFQEIISQSDPDELAGLLDYLFKSLGAIATHLDINLTGIDMISDSIVTVSDENTSKDHGESIVLYCLTVLKGMKNLTVAYNPDLRVNFRVAAHCGTATGGLIKDAGNTARYRVFGNLMETIQKLSKLSKPNCLLITEACIKCVENNPKLTLVQRSDTCIESGKRLRTYWVVST